MKKIIGTTIIFFILCLGLPLMCLASTDENLIAQVELREELKPEYAADLPISVTEGQVKGAVVANVILQLIASGLIYLAGPVAVFMLVIGGLRYVTSHGDQNLMEGAKKTITWAIAGLLVIIVSYAIVLNIITAIERAGTAQQPATSQEQPAQPSGQSTPSEPPLD